MKVGLYYIHSPSILLTGTVKSTEETYKHRMQILEKQPDVVQRTQPFKSILKPARGATGSVPTSPVGEGVSAEQLSPLSGQCHCTRDVGERGRKYYYCCRNANSGM